MLKVPLCALLDAMHHLPNICEDVKPRVPINAVDDQEIQRIEDQDEEGPH